jgi:hypothetical protein
VPFFDAGLAWGDEREPDPGVATKASYLSADVWRSLSERSAAETTESDLPLRPAERRIFQVATCLGMPRSEALVLAQLALRVGRADEGESSIDRLDAAEQLRPLISAAFSQSIHVAKYFQDNAGA